MPMETEDFDTQSIEFTLTTKERRCLKTIECEHGNTGCILTHGYRCYANSGKWFVKAQAQRITNRVGPAYRYTPTNLITTPQLRTLRHHRHLRPDYVLTHRNFLSSILPPALLHHHHLSRGEQTAIYNECPRRRPHPSSPQGGDRERYHCTRCA
jgi:hypothetical protein